MNKFVLAIAALLAFAVNSASAATKYSALTKLSTVTLDVGGAGTGSTNCGATQLAGAHSDTITVAWTGFTSNSEASLTIKMCYTDDMIVNRPWRKYFDAVDKNKQCWQIPEMTKTLHSGIATADGSKTITIPTNTPASTYYFQVIGVDASGGYVSYGASSTNSCKLTTKSYDNTPATLVGTHATLTVISIIALGVTYAVDLRKQQATYAPYVSK